MFQVKLFRLFVFILVLNFLECECAKSDKQSVKTTYRLVKQTKQPTKPRTVRKRVKMVKLRPLLTKKKHQLVTAIPIFAPIGQPLFHSAASNFMPSHPVQFASKPVDQLSLSSSNLIPQFATNDENDYNNNNNQDNREYEQNKLIQSQPVPMTRVPIVSTSPIPVLSSAGVGNFPTTVTFAHANPQAVPTFAQANSNSALVPPAVNLLFETASDDGQTSGEKELDNENEKLIIYDEEGDDDDVELADGNSDNEQTVKVELDKSEDKSKNYYKYTIQSQFDKINQQLEKLNSQNKETEEKDGCGQEHCHQMSDSPEIDETKEKKVIHVVLHQEEGIKLDGEYSDWPFPPSFPPMDYSLNQFRPSMYLIRNEKQFNTPKQTVGSEDDEEGYYKIKVKTPFTFLSKLFDKFIS